MTSRLKLITIVIGILAVNLFAQSGKDQAEVEGVIRSFVLAQTNYDQKALDALFTSDYIEISPLGEFDPRNKVLGFYKPELKPEPAKMSASVDVSELSIRTYRDFAIAIARLNYEMTADGKPLPSRSIRSTVVLKKEKTGWKIASAQYTGIRPPAAPPKTN
jgi:ketosteroid isomerase-like protein